MRWTFRSTFSQIIGLQMLAIAATSLIMPLAIFLFLSRTVDSYQLGMLRHHEQALLTALAFPETGGNPVLPEAVRIRYGPGNGGFAFAVLDSAGTPMVSSQNGQAALAPVPARRTPRKFKRRLGEAIYNGASFPEQLNGRPIWIQVAQNLEDPDVVIDDILAGFLPAVGFLSLALLLLLLVADILIVRRALAPVLRASTLAGAITPSRIDVRLPLDGMPREIAPLILAVNEALERLDRGFRAQRDLTADVAHELRTPLTLLRMRVDALPDAQTRTSLKADIDVMGRIVTQLMAVAELEHLVIDPDECADLRSVCMEVAEHLAPLALGEHKSIELVGDQGPVWVRGQHPMLFQAVRNLAENAVAHTPAGTAVTLDVRPEGAVRVLDRGPGVPTHDRDQLFQRFWSRRGEGSAAGVGAGLGLSIVARIAEEYSGAISVQDRPGGGAVFELRLPLAVAVG